MAYSRWCPSDWYVFWAADSDPPFLEMWFAGGPMAGASYDDLEGIGLEGLHGLLPSAPVESLPELLEYVQDFCADVRDERAGIEPSRW